MQSKPFSALALLAGLVLAGCASVTVKDVACEQTARLPRPRQFVVLPFDVDTGHLKENPARKRPGQLASEAQQLLQGYLSAEVPKLGAPVVAHASTKSPDTWVISGRITRLEEGSRILRMSMGLGMGGTKMETQVEVSAGGKCLMHFATTGGSNAMPGAVTTPVPFTGLPAALSGAKDGVTDDAARTSRMICAAIGQEMVRRGWLASAPCKVKAAVAR
jgi:hypothetical protein